MFILSMWVKVPGRRQAREEADKKMGSSGEVIAPVFARPDP